MDKIEGFLEVGSNDQGEVIINHPDLKPDENGVGHIVFSKNQARNLANLLMKNAGRAPAVTMQMLLDAGFNAFGLQLFAESFAGKINPEKPDAGLPFSFSFRGLRFTVEREPGEEIDTRHH
jgi:hypothetical protein